MSIPFQVTDTKADELLNVFSTWKLTAIEHRCMWQCKPFANQWWFESILNLYKKKTFLFLVVEYILNLYDLNICSLMHLFPFSKFPEQNQNWSFILCVILNELLQSLVACLDLICLARCPRHVNSILLRAFFFEIDLNSKKKLCGILCQKIDGLVDG